MTVTRKFTQAMLSLAMVLSMALSLVQTHSVVAQGGDGVRRQVNSETGKVNFLGPQAGKRSVSARALGIGPSAQAPSPASAAMSLAKRFAPEFGVANPERDLTVMKTHTRKDGQATVRYQQRYQGIPVIAGELIVNTDENGDLYSMNGEASQDLSLDVQPTVAKEAAVDTAKQAMAKWYGGEAAHYKSTQPALWIFDEQLLLPSTRPAELVWRLEITSAKQKQPIRELVLVNAKTGKISLHFNQVDTAWGENLKPGSQATTVNSPAAQTGNTWYVTTGGNDGNSCATTGSPCASVAGALAKAGLLDGDTIKVATGTYNTGEFSISKGVTISGGWNSGFTSQTYTTTNIADPFTIFNGASVIIERITVSRSSDTADFGVNVINPGTTLKFVDGEIRGHPKGLRIFDAQATLINTVVTANSRGIYLVGSPTSTHASVTLLSSTVAFNNLSTGVSGIVNDSLGKVIIENSVIVGNAGGVADCSGKVISHGYNIIGFLGRTWPFVCDPVGAVSDDAGSGSTPLVPSEVIDSSFMPVLGSIALDKGSPVIPGSSTTACPAKDGIGVNRPQGAFCDKGAREYVFNRNLGSMLLKTYDASGGSLPGTLICTQADPTCSATSDNDTRQAHKWATGVYNLYKNKHNRNSLDNNGLEILVAVHDGVGNAFWDNYIASFGDQFANADDVVAHELTHGVTQFESNLFYYYQPGAINESLSDLWGEYYDQNNGDGNDAGWEWWVGEDVGGTFGGPFRYMQDPTFFLDPDKISSPYYYKGLADSGGVHRNSGVNNKAVYLMVAGDFFNGQTITGIGWDKTAAIYYKVQTDLLSSGANYSDLYAAVQQACQALIGSGGISAGDCGEVKKALDAVEMNKSISSSFSPKAAVCPTGMITDPSLTLFSDDFESFTSVTDNWTAGAGWSYADFNSSSPFHAMFGDDQTGSTSAALTLKNSVALPPKTTPFLYFKHSFGFEYYTPEGFYDGGVLEYSKDNGVTWKDAKPLFSGGQNYNGTILSTYTIFGPGTSKNPLKGRQAFVKESHGYVSSRYNLTSLAGQSVKFRWKYGTDAYGSSLGWSVDDVSIYQCVGMPSKPGLVAPLNAALTRDYTPLLDWKDSTPSLDHYQLQIATDNLFTSGSGGSIIEEQLSLPTSQFQVLTDLTPNRTYYWRVQGFNILSQTLGWSPIWSFRTALTPPVLTSPNEGDHLLSRRPALDWENVPEAAGYKLVVSQYANFKPALVTLNVTDSTVGEADWAADLPAKTRIYWRVQATGTNPSGWSAVRSFITGNPPSIPVLVSPANKAITGDYTPLLNWNDSTPSPDHYWLQVATDNLFTSGLGGSIVEEQLTLPTSQFQILTDLTPNRSYYWRVRVYNAAGQFSSWSSVWRFRTALTRPVLTSPADGEHLLSRRPVLDWDDVPEATGYMVVVSQYANFSTPLATINVTDSIVGEADWAADLPAKTRIYWRVQALGTNPSLSSVARSFITGNPPSIPVLAAPTNNALLTDNHTPLLNWKDSTPSPDHYWLQVATDNLFTSGLGGSIVEEQLTLPTSQFQFVTELTPNRTYFWRVRVYNAAGHFSSWSTVWKFRVALPAPGLLAPTEGETGVLRRPVLDWEDIPEATGYTLVVSRFPDFSTPILNNVVVTNSTFLDTDWAADLPANRVIYWRVRANGTISSAWSSSNFTTGP